MTKPEKRFHVMDLEDGSTWTDHREPMSFEQAIEFAKGKALNGDEALVLESVTQFVPSVSEKPI